MTPQRNSYICCAKARIEDYLRTEHGSERLSLERLRDAIDREEAEKRQGEDWGLAKNYVRSLLSWLR